MRATAPSVLQPPAPSLTTSSSLTVRGNATAFCKSLRDNSREDADGSKTSASRAAEPEEPLNPEDVTWGREPMIMRAA